MLSFLRQSLQRSNRSSEQPFLTNQGTLTYEFLPTKPKESFSARVTFKHAELLKMKKEGTPSHDIPPYHWHWDQTEIFQVEKGAVIFTIDGKKRRVTAKDGQVSVPPGVYHTFEIDLSTEEDLVLLGSSPDEEGVEEEFFRNLFGYLDDCQRNGTNPNMFQLLLFMHTHDSSLAIPGLPQWLGKAVSKWGLGFIGGKVIGQWLLGYSSSYKEYSNVENDKTK